MDKILSARVDESVIKRIGALSRKLRTTKKSVIEAAVQAYAEKTEQGNGTDPLVQTHGAWKRAESPVETLRRAKTVFRTAMERHRRYLLSQHETLSDARRRCASGMGGPSHRVIHKRPISAG